MCQATDLRGPRYWTRLSNSSHEVMLVACLWVLALFEDSTAPFTLKDLALLTTLSMVVRRVYTAHLEAAYYRHPELRTQPPKKHAGDVTSRNDAQLREIDFHDRWSMVSHFAMDLVSYRLLNLYPEVDGSLARRFDGTSLEGKVFAKTGTLNGANALSGVLISERGKRLLFSIIANDRPATTRSATPEMDAALVAIAETY